MSDLKRVALTTIAITSGTSSESRKSLYQGNANAVAMLQAQSDASSPAGSMLPPQQQTGSSAGAGAASSSVTSQQTLKTFRFELELFEPNANSFPEFNYNKLCHAEKKKQKKLSKVSNGFSDPFEDNDDDVVRIAKEFEKKYGGGTYSGASTSNKGTKRNKKDDYYDIGAGYDESDSFIDNAEAYDEIIPEEVETVGGGFYINSGALEFKHLSNYERAEDAIKMPKAKKRALSSSSSEDEETNEMNSTADDNGIQSPKDGSSTANTANTLKNGHADKKIKTSAEINSNNKELVSVKTKHKDKKNEKVKNKDENRADYNDDGANTATTTTGLDEKDKDKDKEKEKEKTVKTTTIKDMLKAKRDNFRKMQESDAKVKLMNGEVIKGTDSEDSSDGSSGDDSESDNEPDEKKFKKYPDDVDADKIRTTDVKLPHDLTDDVLNDIQELKDYAKKLMTGGKALQFDDKLTEIFLRIDDSCSCLEKSSRNQVFAHLEFQLSLYKYYLLRKARALRVKQEKTKTKKAFMKFRKAVAEVMPSILLTYEASCREVDQLKSIVSQTDIDNMEPQPKYPKKKFPWNETLRNLLYELFQVRWTSYAVLRTKKETFDEFVYNYFKEKVVPVWPAGWIKLDDIKREIEKRKIAAKKPKENKKPGERCTSLSPSSSSSSSSSTSSSSKNKVIDDETGAPTIINKKSSISIPEQSKSILSSSNSVSIVSTKDLVVTISTTNKHDKKTEVPNGSAQSNSISVTPIPMDTSSTSSCNAKADVPTLQSSSQQKSHKSSSNTNTSASTSPLPSVTNQNHVNHKTTATTTAAAKISTQDSQLSNSSSSRSNKNEHKSSSIEKNLNNNSNNNNSSNNNVNTNHHLTSSAAVNMSSVDLTSPTKRATDHSISTIMSLASSVSPTQLHSTSAKHSSSSSSSSSSTKQTSTTTSKKNSVPSSNATAAVAHKTTTDNTAKTHIITVDNLKNTSEIINTTNQLLNNNITAGATSSSNKTGTISSTVASTSSSKECSIRIRSVANLNSNLEKDALVAMPPNNAILEDMDKVEVESSSESDGVEIVGVFPVVSNKNQYKKGSSSGSRSSSPTFSMQTLKKSNHHKLKNVSKDDVRRNAEHVIMAATELKDSELDVNQIMRALKELEEMQQSSIHISDNSPPSSQQKQRSSSGGSSHTSPVSYTK